jgi:hypothetical protein
VLGAPLLVIAIVGVACTGTPSASPQGSSAASAAPSVAIKTGGTLTILTSAAVPSLDSAYLATNSPAGFVEAQTLYDTLIGSGSTRPARSSRGRRSR